jgi:endonuclease YncB( thermonuclease family)
MLRGGLDMKRTITRIIDGDTFIVNRRIDNTNKVRLANVDAPERGTWQGSQATSTLRRLIGDGSVSLIPVGRSYDRVVAEVRHDRRSVNKAMRQRGY